MLKREPKWNCFGEYMRLNKWKVTGVTRYDIYAKLLERVGR